MCNNGAVSVTLRIEGRTRTIFESPVSTTFHRITASDTRKYHCNGLNNDTNPCPGPTCTTALDDGSRGGRFTYAATYYPQFDDLLITTIAGETPNSGQNESWAIARNFVYLSVGGCQQIVQTDNEVLFALAASTRERPTTFLKLSGPTSARAGAAVTLTVTDGAGRPIEGAKINTYGGQTNVNGQLAITFTAGSYELKANRPADGLFTVRSNKLTLVVSA